MGIEILINEFLNHFYTYEELAEYLNMNYNLVEYILDNHSGDKKEQVERHKRIINSYDETDDSINIETSDDIKIVDLANYIINNNSSLRQTAKAFKISKTSVGEYMNERLPKISIKLYKQVFEVLMSHKSLSMKYKKRQDELAKEIDMLYSGMRLVEISESLGKSMCSIQRDLTNRSVLFNEKMNAQIKQKLCNNKRYGTKK